MKASPNRQSKDLHRALASESKNDGWHARLHLTTLFSRHRRLGRKVNQPLDARVMGKRFAADDKRLPLVVEPIEFFRFFWFYFDKRRREIVVPEDLPT